MNSNTNKGNGQSKLIFDESPLVFSRTIAHAIGLPKAVILQEVHYLTTQTESGRVLEDGFRYVYNSYEEWKEQFFPFWSIRTIKTHFTELEKAGLLISQQPDKSDWNTKKYYRFDFEKFSKWSAKFIGFERKANKTGSAEITLPEVQKLHYQSGNNCTPDSAEVARSSIQRRQTKETDKEDAPNVFIVSSDNETMDKSESKNSGVPEFSSLTLHQQLIRLFEDEFGGVSTDWMISKDAKGSKRIRAYMDKHADCTIDDVRECLRVMVIEKKMDGSMTTVAYYLPEYMRRKRLGLRQYPEQFKTAQEKSLEKLKNRNYKELIKGAEEIYEQISAGMPIRRKRP